MKKNIIDKFFESVSPSIALKRYRTRMAIRKYEAAAKGRRTSSMKADGSSANMEVHGALQTLRNRSRMLVRNNPTAKNAVRVIANNVIGTGILPTPKYEGKNAKNINETIKKTWKIWADKTDCDCDGQLNFYGLQHLVIKTVVESGECLIRRIYAGSEKKVPLELQVLEGDFIDTYKHDSGWNAKGERNYYGIRLNKKGKRIGYWLYKNHPVEYGLMESVLVDAKDVIHIYDIERPGQIRGVPFLAASMLRMMDLDKYEDAELLRQQIAACFTVFITEDADTDGNTTNSKGDLERVEPGIIEHLPPGKSVTFAQPPVTQGYDPYTRSINRNIAAGIGLTYESMTGDLSNVNFSSGRMGWLEAQRNYNHWQWNMIIPKGCEKIYEWFIEAIGLKGYIPQNLEVPVKWTPPRREMIDPSKEIGAMKDAVRNGFNSWQNVVEEQGFDSEEVFKELKEEADKFKDAGLQPESNPLFDKDVKKVNADTAILLYEKGIVTKNERNTLLGTAITKDGDVYAGEAKNSDPLAVQIGVGGVQALQGIVADINLTPEAKKNCLMILFGIAEDDAKKIVGVK